MFYSCRGLAEGILKVTLFMVLCFKCSVKEHCVAKIFLAIWGTFLNENNYNLIL